MSIDQSLAVIMQPEIAPRVGVLLGAVAFLGAALVIRRMSPRSRSPTNAMLLRVAKSGFVYLLLGVSTRLMVQEHRSRQQIVVLLGVVLVVEAILTMRGERFLRALTWCVGSTAICLGVIAAKWALEPDSLSHGLAVLQNTGRWSTYFKQVF